MWLRFFIVYPIALLIGVGAAGALVAGLIFVLAYPNLPSLETLTDYQPKIPLRVYSEEGILIGEFGEERRSVVSIRDVPKTLIHAIVAAEDERFYQHAGIDYLGVVCAAYTNLVAGGRRQGASTITMQVARNFFLSSEKTLTRKVFEAMLAFKIEHNLSKDQILELYVNQIYLGQRAYGFAAAARTYYGKALGSLSLAETAMLAGLPKAPSSYNPVANPQRAKQRQRYVLRRMQELRYITAEQYAEAVKAPLKVQREKAREYAFPADYVAEMVRAALYEQYPDEVYTTGFRVYTTIRKKDQEIAYAALRSGLLDYDRRQRFRGPEGRVELAPGAGEEAIEDALADYRDSEDMLPAIVISANRKEVEAALRDGTRVHVTGDGLRFAARGLDARAPAQRRIQRGSIIRVRRTDKRAWEITQLPETEGAFIALDPQDGAIRALVGGFDFGRSKFNHVTQAWRQPGSSFKPFIYSAALEKGLTPATVIPDEPIVIDAEITGSQRWEPSNYDGKFEGPMRLRRALAKSKNMVSIRVLEAIGPQYAQDYVRRFGFDAAKHPPYLTMALGAGSVTPLQMARAYAVFANGGYLIEPYFIKKIVDDRGNILGEARPAGAGDKALRVIDPRNAFIMDNLLKDVTRYGTAARVARLKRHDLAGKTGTTNEFVDAWFAGYQPGLVGIAWIGYDQPRSLGRNQTGGAVALPVWIDYMEKILKGVPEVDRSVPPGVVTLDVVDFVEAPRPDDPAAVDLKIVPEFFYREYVPQEEPWPPTGDGARGADAPLPFTQGQ